MSFGNVSARWLRSPGGINMAKGIIPGTFGTVNPEARSLPPIQTRSSSPVASGTRMCPAAIGSASVTVPDLQEARHWLESADESARATGVKAVENGNVRHLAPVLQQPYQFVAIQEIAKWLHPVSLQGPRSRGDIQELHERFLPLEYKPGYFVSLKNDT